MVQRQDDSVQPANTLFSSSSCKYCALFMKQLNQNFLINDFNIIDVEKTAFDVSKVKVVPTIIVNNNRALSGRDAFAWLQNEVKNQINGVETYGISSAYTYISNDAPVSAEMSMSSRFVDVNEAPEVSAERVPEKDKQSAKSADLQNAVDRLKAERDQGMS